MANTEPITAERLRKLLHYDPFTGVFTWLQPRRKCTPGKVAGFSENNRYVVIRVDYIRCYAHRLAWLYMTGKWPTSQIDHRNRNKADNRWDNLREATQKQNCENMSAKVSKYGTGISWHKRDKLWIARITHHRKKITLGYFKSIEDAKACRREAEIRLFTHSQACEQLPENP